MTTNINIRDSTYGTLKKIKEQKDHTSFDSVIKELIIKSGVTYEIDVGGD